jgi:hypothetical protein
MLQCKTGFAEVGSQRNFALVRYTSDLALGVLDFKITNTTPLVYPNPVAFETTLSYELKKNETISVSLMNLQGVVLKYYFINQKQSAGNYSIPLAIENELPTGCYFLNISIGSGQTTVKIIKR